jgi:hypothetical protein
MELCKYLGIKTGKLVPANANIGKLFVYECNHPDHEETTIPECFRCPHTTVKPDPNCISCQQHRNSI